VTVFDETWTANGALIETGVSQAQGGFWTATENGGHVAPTDVERMHLASAAPEMFKALERLLGGDITHEDLKAARAALRKARGEE
jgi:hypothetical protein